jgi:hypothetical protein
LIFRALVLSCCVSASGEGKISVKNVGIYADEGFKEICGYAVQNDPENPGNLEVKEKIYFIQIKSENRPSKTGFL